MLYFGWRSASSAAGALPSASYTSVPYCSNNSDALFVVETGTSQKKKSKVNTTKRGKKPKATQKCKICSSQIAEDMMRDHVGYHILHTPASVTPEYPCGFCGGAEAAACGIVLTKDQKKQSYVAVKLASNCACKPDLSTFSYKAAGNCSMKHPCTNVPITCTACDSAIWSYSMQKHWNTKHSTKGNIPLHIKQKIEVTSTEKAWVKAVGGENKRLTKDLVKKLGLC